VDVNTDSSHSTKDELQLTEGMARPAIPWIVLQAQMALLASLVAFPAEASPLLHDGLAQAVRQLLQKLQGGTCSQQDDGGGQDGASDAALQGLQAMAGELPPPPRVQCKPVVGKVSNGSRDLQAAAQRSQGSSETVQSHAHEPMPMRPRSEKTIPLSIPGAGHAALLRQAALPHLLAQLAPPPPDSVVDAQQQAASALAALAALSRARAELRSAVLAALRCAP